MGYYMSSCLNCCNEDCSYGMVIGTEIQDQRNCIAVNTSVTNKNPQVVTRGQLY